jgi:hypothetical protein
MRFIVTGLLPGNAFRAANGAVLFSQDNHKSYENLSGDYGRRLPAFVPGRSGWKLAGHPEREWHE